MTSPFAAPADHRRTGPLATALAVVALALPALGLGAGAAGPVAGGGAAGARVALVADAGPHPAAVLARARAWAARARASGARAAVRLPRTAAEARTDLRYLAAAGYRTVLVSG